MHGRGRTLNPSSTAQLWPQINIQCIRGELVCGHRLRRLVRLLLLWRLAAVEAPSSLLYLHMVEATVAVWKGTGGELGGWVSDRFGGGMSQSDAVCACAPRFQATPRAGLPSFAVPWVSGPVADFAKTQK